MLGYAWKLKIYVNCSLRVAVQGYVWQFKIYVNLRVAMLDYAWKFNIYVSLVCILRLAMFGYARHT